MLVFRTSLQVDGFTNELNDVLRVFHGEPLRLRNVVNRKGFADVQKHLATLVGLMTQALHLLNDARID